MKRLIFILLALLPVIASAQGAYTPKNPITMDGSTTNRDVHALRAVLADSDMVVKGYKVLTEYDTVGMTGGRQLITFTYYSTHSSGLAWMRRGNTFGLPSDTLGNWDAAKIVFITKGLPAMILDTFQNVSMPGSDTIKGNINSPNLTANTAVILDANKNHVSSATTSAELAQIHGLTASRNSSTVGLRSVDANMQVNEIEDSVITIVTDGGIDSLKSASAPKRIFTGSSTKTEILPDTASVAVSHWYWFINNSSGSITIKTFNGFVISTITGGKPRYLELSLVSGVKTWVQILDTTIAGISGLTSNNVDQITVTYPNFVFTAGSPIKFGTTDANALNLYTNNISRMTIASSGSITYTNDLNNQQSISANTTATGLQLQNLNTASASNQSYSEAVVFTGYGWKTNSTASSQSVSLRQYMIPVQGAANPTAKMVFEKNINGAGYSSIFEMNSDGTYKAPGYTTNNGLLITDGSGNVSQTGAGTSTQAFLGGGAGFGAINLTSMVSGILPVGGGGTGSATQNWVDLTTTQSGIVGLKTWSTLHTFNSTNTASSGTDYGHKITPTYNQTSTASGIDLYINRTQTAAGSGLQLSIAAGAATKNYWAVKNDGSMFVSESGNSVDIGTSSSGNAIALLGASGHTWGINFEYQGGTPLAALNLDDNNNNFRVQGYNILVASRTGATRYATFFGPTTDLLLGAGSTDNGFAFENPGSTKLGGTINIAAGANKSASTATLSSGTVTVSNTRVTASSLILVWYITPSGTLASGLATPSASIVAGTSFVINSLTTAGVVNTLDNSTVGWLLIN